MSILMAASGSGSDSSSSSRVSLRELSGVLRVIEIAASELRADMQVQTLRVFLVIATQGDVAMAELMDAVGVSSSAISRNVDQLAAGPHGKPGMGWLEVYVDPLDRRFKRVKLTPKGATVAKQMHGQVMKYVK
jgi:DNA-binding MarR family transcriptional regulator